MTDQVERANAYNTAVGGVGYAGILTIFSLTNVDLPPKARAIVALLLLGSIALYVFWVVLNMFLRAQWALTGSRTETAPFGRPWYRWAWYSALALTITTALAAACIMASFYVCKILS